MLAMGGKADAGGPPLQGVAGERKPDSVEFDEGIVQG